MTAKHSERHRTGRIGWLRASVLGVNDGIVSTASLIVGVAAANAVRGDVLITGVAGLVAGAMSMAAGEYVSVSSQADTEQAELARERKELGVAILAKRNRKPVAHKKNFYLLQGLIYLQMPGGELIKLTCSKPNTKRTQAGIAYYCIPGSQLNFSCQVIDDQFTQFLQNIQVSPDLIPQIRRAYLADINNYTLSSTAEQSPLEQALERAKTKELNLWRAFTEHGMRAETFEKLAREYQDEQDKITFALKAIQQENRETIANLDAALAIIAQIGERYHRQDHARKRAIVRQVVDRVVIDLQGHVLRLELKSPFIYLHHLADEGGDQQQEKRETKRWAGKQTSSSNKSGCSLHVEFGTPNGKELEHHSSLNNLLIEFLQRIAFPQNAQFVLLETS